ncbi:hypothetical protein Acr_07g0015100 [Actinidia rufa]|uniref:Uncharacterized protein n=1 Tax=Actinidia rufa TaxID=165716 RepID=A0A7J0EXY0_9ERIC|nr:hypothetical protein Acr_07g0015100 [Actinidia rufa]
MLLDSLQLSACLDELTAVSMKSHHASYLLSHVVPWMAVVCYSSAKLQRDYPAELAIERPVESDAGLSSDNASAWSREAGNSKLEMMVSFLSPGTRVIFQILAEVRLPPLVFRGRAPPCCSLNSEELSVELDKEVCVNQLAEEDETMALEIDLASDGPGPRDVVTAETDGDGGGDLEGKNEDADLDLSLEV